MTTDTAKLTFTLDGQAPSSGVRYGRVRTEHGEFETPAFMPVGTYACVKTQTPEDLRKAGVQILLANAYHCACRPGEELIQSFGGLHGYMGWDGPILTDSGGYQVFSLSERVRKTDDGAVFRCHISGRPMEMGPERAIEIQTALGTDIAMVFDDCPPYPSTPRDLRRSVERTIRWAERCRKAQTSESPALFGIVQGGVDPDQRAMCAQEITKIGFDGYAVGGLSVGEPMDLMRDTVEVSCAHLPTDRVRYLMGVGTPQDILAAVERGIDMFDCVIPTRAGRNALAYTSQGLKRMRNAQWANDKSPLDPDCPCPACTQFTLGYLRHLFISREILGASLVTTHNITYYQRLMQGIRESARENRFAEFRDRVLASLEPAPSK